eukprot:COSAG01_NODE_2443_length_7689_cov_5.414229_7_plen_229_part_00
MPPRGARASRCELRCLSLKSRAGSMQTSASTRGGALACTDNRPRGPATAVPCCVGMRAPWCCYRFSPPAQPPGLPACLPACLLRLRRQRVQLRRDLLPSLLHQPRQARRAGLIGLWVEVADCHPCGALCAACATDAVHVLLDAGVALRQGQIVVDLPGCCSPLICWTRTGVTCAKFQSQRCASLPDWRESSLARTTSAMSATSRPRAATSVATSTRPEPSAEKSARAT